MMARNNIRKAEMITTDYYRDGDESRREVDHFRPITKNGKRHRRSRDWRIETPQNSFALLIPVVIRFEDTCKRICSV